LSPAFAAAEGAKPAQPPGQLCDRTVAVTGDPPGRRRRAYRTGWHGRSVLLLRDGAPGRARAEQLSKVHAGTERDENSADRPRGRRYSARQRARRAAL